MHSEVQEEKSFQEHLEELLIRARRALIAIMVGVGVASVIPSNLNLSNPAFQYETLISSLLKKVEEDLLPKEAMLIGGSWMGSIMAYFYLAILVGFLMASPIVSYEVYKYVAPALYPHEKRFLTLFVLSFIGLSISGVLFSYFFILPWTYRFLILFVHMVGAQPFFFIEDFLSFTVMVMLTVGLTFTFPVVIALLVKFEIVTPQTLTSRWREVVVLVLIISALVTPDVSGFTMLMLTAPLIALYVASVAIAKLIYRGRRAKEAEPLLFQG